MDVLKQVFNKETQELSIRRVRLTSVLSFSLFSLFGLLDYFVFPDKLTVLLSLRLLNAFVALSVLFLSYRSFGPRYSTLLGALDYLSLGFIISGMVFITGGHASIYYTGLIVIIIGICYIMPWSLKESIPLCSAVYLSYLLPIILFDKIDNPKLFINSNFFLLCTIFIIIISTYYGNRLRFKEFEARYNLAHAKTNLESAYSKLQELDNLKTQFFSNISHEFRTPLTLILAPAESMLRGRLGMLSPQVKEDVKVIYNSSLKLMKLIDDLLDIAKIDAQKMELDLEKSKIVELIKNLVASVENIAEKKKLKLYYTQKNKISAFYFDRDKIEKVLLNLISNALKFTDKGEIEITSEKQDEKAIIKIRDTGIGIAEKDLPKMFNRFVQLDDSTTRRHEGTGLGLSLSRDLVRLHQGDIKIESKIGEGTAMIVELPLNLEKDIMLAKVPKEVTSKLSKSDDWLRDIHKKAQYASRGIIEEKLKTKKLPALRKRKKECIILVVEDNPDMLNFIALQLKDNYQAIGAKDGQEGLELAKKYLPDLVVTDIMMPKMSGYDLLKAMREDYSLKNIPVIFLTAKAGLDMKIEGLEYGADDYLIKPFNSQELLARVKNLITIRELQRELYSIAKLASVGQLAAGTAHEINNPLAASMTELRVLKREFVEQNKDVNKERLNELILRSYTSLERIEKIVKNLLSFSRKNREGVKFDDIHEGLNSTLSVLRHELKDKISVHKQYCSDGKIECDLGKLNQVFMNVILNSTQAIKNKGNIWITTARKADSFIVSIRDDGEGIKKEHLNRVLAPFFTTKDVNQGVGLGLTVSYNLIKEHGGDMAIKSEHGKGTEAIIAIPIKVKAKG